MNCSSHRVAFYPCCARDITAPCELLRGLVHEIIYCDLKRPGVLQQSVSKSFPRVTFVCGNAIDVLVTIPIIHVLFYRRDSGGEGGSGQYILNKRWLAAITRRMPDSGGLIITDGSNSGNAMFRRMTRVQGFNSKALGCRFMPAAQQPWIQSLGLHIIEVTKNTQQSAAHVREARRGPRAGAP